MKKNLLIPAVFAVALTALVSCEDKNKISEEMEDMKLAIMPSSSVSLSQSTKASIDGSTIIDGETFPKIRAMRVAAFHNAAKGQGDSTNYFKDKQFSYRQVQDETAACWYENTWWPAKGTLDLMAFSVDNFEHVTDVAWKEAKYSDEVTLKLTDNSGNQEDLLFACAVGAKRKKTESGASVDGAVKMVFHHALAKVSFVAYSDVSYNATTNQGCTIDDIQVLDVNYSGQVKATNTEGQLSFSWSSLGDKKSLFCLNGTKDAGANASERHDINSTDPENPDNMSGKAYPLLVIPQEQTRVLIKYTVHNGKDLDGNVIDNHLENTFTLSTDEQNPTMWLPETWYQYQIHITMTELSIEPKVKAWTVEKPVIEF